MQSKKSHAYFKHPLATEDKGTEFCDGKRNLKRYEESAGKVIPLLLTRTGRGTRRFLKPDWNDPKTPSPFFRGQTPFRC